MPQTVEVPELGIVEFPDDMTPDSISAILRKRTQPKEPEPFPVIPPSPARTPEELSYRNMMGEQALGTAVPAPVAHGPLLDVPAALPETLIRASMKVPIPSLAQAIRLLPESEREPAIKGISESAAEGLSGLTTPENLAIGAGLAIAPEIGLPLLVAHMQSQVPEAIQAIDEAETPKEKWKAIGNLTQLAGMIVAPAAKPILKGLRGTERVQAEEQPVPPVIPRGPEPPPLPEVPPEPPPSIPKPVERVVEDYIEAEPTETVVKGEEFTVPAKAAEVLPEAARAAEEAGAKIEQPAAPAVEPEKGAPIERATVPTLDRGTSELRGTELPALSTAVKIAEQVDPNNTGPLLQAFRQVHSAGYEGADALRGAWSLYAASAENPAIKNYTDFKNSYAVALEVQMRVVHDALKTKGATDATQEGQVKESFQPERVGTDAQRVSTTPSPSDRVQPAAPVPEAPETGPTGAEVLLKPERGTIEYEQDVSSMVPLAEKLLPNWNGGKVGKNEFITRNHDDKAEKYPWRITYLSEKSEPISHTYHTDAEASRLLAEKIYVDDPEVRKLLGRLSVPSEKRSTEPVRKTVITESGKTLAEVRKTEERKRRTPRNEAEQNQSEFLETSINRSKASGMPAIGSYEAALNHATVIIQAIRERKPISATAFDLYATHLDILSQNDLPKEYVREGDRYIYRKDKVSEAGVEPAAESIKSSAMPSFPSQESVSMPTSEKAYAGSAVPPVGQTGISTRKPFSETKKTLPASENEVKSTPAKAKEPVAGVSERETILERPDVSVPVKAKRQEGVRASKPLTQKEVDRLGTSYEEAKRIYGEHNLETQRRFIKWFEAADYRKKVLLARQQAKEPAPPAAAEPGKGPGMVGMGGAVPSEFVQSPETPTGIRNRIVDQERAKRGLPPAVEPAKRSFGEVWDRAMALIDRDPVYQDRLIDELREKPRALTDIEDATILQRQIDLQNEYGKATRDLAQAYDDGRMADVEREKLRVAGLSDRLLDLYDIGKKVGTETGRGLNARRMMAYEDFSLAKMELEKRAANGGRRLTDAERQQIEALHNDIKRLDKAYDQYLESRESRLAELEADAAMGKLKAQSPLDKRVLDYAEKFVKGMELTAQRYIKELSGTLWTPTPEMLAKAAFIGATKIARGTLEIAKWTDEMVADLGEKFRPYAAQVYDMANKTLEAQLKKVPKPVQEAVKSKPSIGTKEAIAKKIGDKIEKGKADQIWFLVNKLARELYKEGITEREAMVDALHQFLPELSREEVRDAFSGYGNYRPLTKDAISIGLRGMKGELLEIAKLEAMAKGEPPLKSGAERGEITEARRQLIKKVNDAKYKFQVPVEDPETQLKSALDTLKTTLKNRITDYEDRLARGDFAPRPRREIVLDRTAMELKAQAEKVKRRWRAGLLADQLKNRTRYERAMDTLVKWRRGFVLSGFTTLGKLTSAAVQRMTFTPAEEAVGAAWQKLPGIRKIAERAPREGGFSPKAEAQAITQAWTQGRKDAWQVLKTGRGTLDYLFGTKDTYIGELDAEQRSIVDFFGQMHGFLKAPVKRAEFARSMEKRLEWNIRQGVDVSDPLIQTRIAIEAYKDGNRSIFLQDNMVSDKVRRFINSFEQKSKATGQVPIMGKLAATTGRVLLPITKVPTNIVAETIQYAIGAERGLFKAMRAIRAGTENLKPEEADLIMRDLKKGALGSAFLLIGFFSPEVIGGYYQPGEKRRKSDVKPGMIRMYGQEVPSFLLHNPLLETLQLGATIRRVSDSKLRKRDTENQGIGAGIQAGALGLTEQVPFVREMMEVTKAWNPRERGAFFGELGKSIIIPQGVQQAARYFDQNAAGETIVRKPRNMVEHIETGIPGLRENVPRAPRQPSR